MATLFAGATPAGSQFLDGSPGIKVALTFNFAKSGQVSELWWYCGAQNGGTWTLTMWDITTGDSGGTGAGTQLASQAFVGTPTANAWNKVTLGASVSVASGNKRYRVAVHNAQYYWVDNGFFSGHDEVSGDISALRNDDASSSLGTIKQGTFIVDASATSYPTQTGSQALYPVDVTFTADASLDGTATVGGASALSASGFVTLFGTATVGGTSALSASGSLTLFGTATVGGASSLAAAGFVTLFGTATLGGSSALSADGVAGVIGTATVGESSALSATGFVSQVATFGVTMALAAEGTVIGGASAETPAGWETIRGAINEARAQHLKHEERRRRPIDCPVHLWPLEVVGNVYHCKFGGHTVRLPAPSP